MTLGVASGALPIIPLSFIGKVPVNTPTTLTIDRTTTPLVFVYGFYSGAGNASMSLKIGGDQVALGGNTDQGIIGMFAYDSVADVWYATLFSNNYGTNTMSIGSGSHAGNNTFLFTPTNCGALVYGINIR
jgi:hypothetical protein